MRYVIVFFLISLISFNVNAAPRTDDTVTDMMTGEYSCGVTSDGRQKINITAATHIEVREIQPHFYDPFPRCITFFDEITTLLQLYNCVTHPHPELDENLNFVCRGTREGMVNLTADIYEHMQRSYPE